MYLCLFVLAVFGGGIHIPYTFTGLAYAHDFDPVRQAETNKYLDTEHDENCDNDEGTEWMDLKPPDKESCDGEGQEVSYETLVELLDSGDIQLIDVRDPVEFAEGSIPDAINVPLDEFTDALTMPPDQFEMSFGAPKPQPEDTNIVFQCLAGVRSLLALNAAADLGYHKARHYPGGWEEWEQRTNES